MKDNALVIMQKEYLRYKTQWWAMILVSMLGLLNHCGMLREKKRLALVCLKHKGAKIQ